MAYIDEDVKLNFNDLPDHVIVQIFKYSKKDTNTLLVLRLVCQKWNFFIESYGLLSHLWFKFEDVDFYRNHEFVRAVTDNIVDVRNLQLRGCDFIWRHDDFMKALAKTVRHLDIEITNVDENWMAFFTNARHLTTLVLNMEMNNSPQGAVDILLQNVNEHQLLKSITFIGAIEKYVLDYFRKTAINLSVLVLDSGAHVSHGAIERILTDRLATLVDVEFRLLSIPESAFHLLSRRRGLPLRSFIYHGNISPNLEILLSSEVNIEVLRFNARSGNLEVLHRLRKLKDLHIVSNCPEENFIDLNITNNKFQLEKLYIDGNSTCSIISTNLVKNLCLKVLRLGTAKTSPIHVDTIKAVADKYPNLLSLSIQNCDAVSLAYICDKLVNLTELKICNTNSAADDSFAGLMPEQIVKLVKLKVLEIRNFTDIFDDDFLLHKFRFSSLEVLNLNMSLQRVSFRGILGIAIHCPNVKVLNLQGLGCLYDNFNELFEHMPKLRKLRFC